MACHGFETRDGRWNMDNPVFNQLMSMHPYNQVAINPFVWNPYRLLTCFNIKFEFFREKMHLYSDAPDKNEIKSGNSKRHTKQKTQSATKMNILLKNPYKNTVLKKIQLIGWELSSVFATRFKFFHFQFWKFIQRPSLLDTKVSFYICFNLGLDIDLWSCLFKSQTL